MTNERILTIVDSLDMHSSLLEYIVNFDGSVTDGFADWYNDILLNEISTDQERALVLMIQKDFTYEEAYNKSDNCEYYVLTENEANEACDERLDNYLDDDGNEAEQTINGTTYYIYRAN